MFFYYDNFGNIYNNRYDALNSSEQCHLYWYDKELSKINWKIEPVESLTDLYKDRAQWIRDNYDYVIVAYSGGMDSTNVLESFYYNNIHIDEILTIGAFSQSYAKDSDKNLCEDIYKNVIPTLNKLNLSKTKITIEDYTKSFNDIKKFNIIQNHELDWYKNIGCFYSVHNFFWNNLQYRYNKKNTALVFGTARPLISYDKISNKTYTFFSDFNLVDYGNLPYEGNFQKVNFYTDLSCFKIILKQSHIILKFINECKKYEENFSIFGIINDKGIVNDSIVRHLIYQLKNPLNYYSKKSKNNLISIRDSYIFDKKNSDLYEIYNNGLLEFSNNFKYDIKNISPIRTKRYYLE